MTQINSNNKQEIILIVEDSPTQAEKLKYILEQNGYAVILARNGKGAIREISNNNPALVISDIIMPEMDGFELCNEIKSKEETQDIPVILVTSLTRSEDVLKGLACGADNFLTKPYSEKYLLSIVNQIFANRDIVKHDRIRVGAEISFGGKKRFISASQQQMLTLLISSYEAAVQKNNELAQAQQELETLNEHLEDIVTKRTEELSSEIKIRIQAQQEVSRLNEELEERVIIRTNQLNAANKELEAFSYSVSHDLRAPLRAISGFTKIILDDYQSALDEEGKHFCKLIVDNTNRMEQLIEDLLALSKVGRADIVFENINMRELAKVVLAELTTGCDMGRLTISIEELSPCFGDPILIRQVWTNLLSNAIKYSSTMDHSNIIVGCENSKEEIVYFVKDNGVGFDMKYYDKLFGVFQRLHNTSEFNGTGVGLAIVRRIIQRHFGRTWAEGQIGLGASFFFSLPLENINSRNKLD